MNDKLTTNQIEYIKALRNDFTFAANELFCSAPEVPLELWWGQQYAISCMKNKRVTFLIGGRGTGKTFDLAVFCTLRALLFPRHRVGITSASFRQSKFVFAEIQRIYEYSPIFRSSCSKRPTIGSDTCTCEFNNMSSITALPLGDGEKIRGSRFHSLAVDEAVKIPEEILQVSIMPMLNVKKDPMISVARENLVREAQERGEVLEVEDDFNQIIFSTTAWFQYSFLYGLLKDARKEIEECELNGQECDKAIVEFGYKDPPDGFLDLDHIEMTKRTMNPVWFAMENLAFWPPDTDGFYQISIMEQCKDLSVNPLTRGRKGKRYIVAVDPAREEDNFILMVAELEKTYAKLVYVKCLNKATFSEVNAFKEMHDEIRRIVLAFDPERIALDSGGGGLPLRDMLAEDYIFTKEDGQKVLMGPIFQIEGQRKEHDEIRDPSANRILDLVHFSTRFVNDSSWRLRKMFETKFLRLATSPLTILRNEEEVEDPDKKIMVSRRDILANEMDLMIQECSNIITIELPTQKGSFKFDTPQKSMKKDRWAAMILMAHEIEQLLGERDVDLASGGRKESTDVDFENIYIKEAERKIKNNPLVFGMINETKSPKSYRNDFKYDIEAAALGKD